MLTNKKRMITKKTAAGIILCISLLGAVVFGLEKTNILNFFPDNPSLSPGEQEDKEINDAAKKKFIEDTKLPSNDDTETSTESKTSRMIELTAKQEVNGSVTVLTKLFGFSDGTCNLSASNGGKNFMQSAGIIYQPEFSSCAGFSIPKNSLGSGSWIIQLTITDSTSPSSTKTATLEVK